MIKAIAAFLASFGFLLAPAFAQEVVVTEADLAAAGFTGATRLAPSGDRFKPPPAYFKVNQTIPATMLKKDCADCASLVAAYVGTSETIPSWGIRGGVSMRTIGARSQARLYDRSTKHVIIVTGPDEAKVRKLAELLDAKY